MDWKQPQRIEENNYKIPGNWISIHYFEALNILFRIENALRIFVYLILKDNFNEKWHNLSVTSDDDDTSTISGIAKKRIAQDENFAYLGYTNTNPLLYTTSGELIRLVTSDAYWKYFKNYFLGSREIMKNKLDEIGKVRNTLAHFRPIKETDVELLKQNADHTLKLIQDNIYQLIRCPDIVPSNTEDEWFVNLRTLGTENITFKFNQSSDQKWVKVQIDYLLSIIERENYGKTAINFRTTRLKANNMLTEYSNFTKYILLLSERVPYVGFRPDQPIFRKTIMFIISRKSLSEHNEEIKSELEKFIITIDKETELIKKDGLARGKIIEGINVMARQKEYESSKFYWDLESDAFLSVKNVNDPPEYWGNFNIYSDNFISDTENYPWMQAQISEDKQMPF